ncbi:Quinate/shikimate dehydrogenase (quinone) [Serratia quinivorans]|nr:Quinate/shikimate dehydrogenase (quinone) [Serratia quinivorans]
MPESNTRPGIKLKLWCCLLGIILTVVGLFFAIAGGKLVSLGGSSYFLVAGIVTLLAAVQFFRRKSSAVVLFLLVFIGTLIWSVYDAGYAVPVFFEVAAPAVIESEKEFSGAWDVHGSGV